MADKEISTITVTTDDGYVVGSRQADGVLRNWDTKPWSRGRLRGINNITSASYDLVADDEGKLIIHVNASASVINIKADANLVWPVNGRCLIVRNGTGQITMTPAVGVTLLAAGRKKFRVKESCAELIKVAANTWVFHGDTLA